jgi:hypothetical protein
VLVVVEIVLLVVGKVVTVFLLAQNSTPNFPSWWMLKVGKATVGLDRFGFTPSAVLLVQLQLFLDICKVKKRGTSLCN